MCEKRPALSLCWNLKCPHNIFWEKLNLDIDQIHVTKKALEIGNCCCSIRKPWTPEEIEAVWGLSEAEVRQCEGMAWKKIIKSSQNRLFLLNPGNRSLIHGSSEMKRS